MRRVTGETLRGVLIGLGMAYLLDVVYGRERRQKMVLAVLALRDRAWRRLGRQPAADVAQLELWDRPMKTVSIDVDLARVERLWPAAVSAQQAVPPRRGFTRPQT